MLDNKQFNPLPLLSVKNGLDSSLAQINTELESYFSAGQAGLAHLKTAHDELHRAVGVLQMLSLEGLAVFSKEFETVLQEMLAQQQAPSALHRDTLRGAVIALTQYLDALVDGASNTALRLFYSYQELHQLRGMETAFEVDLFFPEFGVELPSEVLNVPLQPAAADTIKKARAHYQRALLKWLRQDNPAQSLATMRSAVQNVMACAPQDQHRAFWWIATGLLDCLIHDGLPAELNANKLLARIDLQMKSMLEQKPRDSEQNTTRNMQYMLARSHSVSETVDNIKQTYVLDSYLPTDQLLSQNEIAPVLEQMHERLTAAQEILEQCMQGDAECSKRFADELEQIYLLSEKLDRDTLQFLCKQMHHIVADPADADAVHRLRMEMAMAMLLLGHGIERYHRLGSQFHEQARMIVQLLQSGIVNDSVQILPHLSEAYCQAEEHEVLQPLAHEMKGNLQQIELNLNVFFSDANSRGELPPLRRLLTQVHGGFFLLGLETASRLVMPVQQAVERYINGANPAHAEMHAIASAVSALENYTHGLSQGQKPDSRVLQEVLDNLQSGTEKAHQQHAAPEIAVPTGVAVREGGEDAELLEVFLEEASEVLETLHKHLQACQRNPHSREDLVIIRRGFHTLKGSGRMVGLTNLGEVAWSIEKALNKWLQDEKPTSLTVLELIGDAEVLFQHWVEKLRSGGSALIDATALVAAALRVENGVPETPEAEAPAETEAELPDIVIGGVSLSPMLFNIATDEAGNIIETLQRLVAELRRGEHEVITNDFLRAAHTLAGVSRSTGFTVISDLAGALELWLQDFMELMAAPDILQLNLLEQSISALTDMVNILRRKQEPKPRPDLITRLQIKKKLLSKSQPDDPLSLALSDHSDISTDYAVDIADPDPSYTADTLPAEPVAVLNDEDDLVAFVQRATQDDVSAPLNWQSPEPVTPANDTQLAHPAGILPAEELNSPFSIDMSDLQSQLVNEPEHTEIAPAAAAPNAFNFNFDELAPAPQAESAPSSQQLLNSLESAQNKPEVDFLSSLTLADLEQQEAELLSKNGITHEELADAHSQATAAETFNFNFDELALGLSQQSNSQPANTEPKPAKADLSPASNPVEAIDLAALQPAAKPANHAAEIAPQRDTAVAAHPEEELANQSNDGKQRVIHDDLDAELLPIFMEEADELYPQLMSELASWREKIDDAEAGQKIARTLQRSLHTLKGSARMAGAMRLGELTHRIEDTLDAAVAQGRHDLALLEELENFFDRIGNSLEKLRKGDTSVETVEPVVTSVKQHTPNIVAAAQTAVMPEVLAEAADERKESAVLRVRSNVVDDLVNEAAEISVARSRMEIELSSFKGGLQDLNSSVQGLRKLVREIEIHAEGQMQARAAVAGDSAEKFDPLEFDRFTRFQELTRFMSESVHDVQTVQQTLMKNLDETTAAMSAQAKLNSALQQNLMSIRMLPFSSISQRLYRIVRQTGKELNKRANLELYGTEIELDRGVLEKMTAPFEHLLRNSIVHGLESAEQRELLGKHSIGNISLRLRQEGNEVVFEFKDDGAGLNVAKLRQKAVEQGLLKPNEIISDEKAMLLIFETGLSTAAELTEISGRGVGMDVVRSEIKALGGRIEVSSEQGKGASFNIYLPLTLAVMKSLMVRAATEIYALPSVMVEQVQQVKPDTLAALYQTGHVAWQDKIYPLYYLPRLLGDTHSVPESKPYNPVLLLRSGEQRVALHLDELLGNRESVVKNVGAQLARLPGIAGATVQANGKVVLILNPIPLAQQQAQEAPQFNQFTETIVPQRTPLIMIVDDSLTVRKITSRLLNRAGYDVITAKDGVDALEQLVDVMPDVMLLDVEMPRMDGFELTKQLRRDERTSKLPIIMITSRTADKHRNYALEMGVNEYLGKPYQDDELLLNIARFAPLKEAATAA
jgi:chemosensory pili system protein ChpA (sensor histidine kinase/response regulator)